MKAQMNRRNYNNNKNIAARAQAYKITRQNILVSAMIVAFNFGVKAFSFLNNLVTVGRSAYDGLHRGHIRQMYWLPYVAKY